MLKYRTGGYDDKIIEAVEVDHESKDSVWINIIYNKTVTCRRSKKMTSYQCYFDTWDEAFTFLLDKAERQLKAYRGRVEYAIEQLNNIKGLKKP